MRSSRSVDCAGDGSIRWGLPPTHVGGGHCPREGGTVKGKILVLSGLVAVLVLSLAASAVAVPMIRTYRATLVELNGSGVTGTAEITMLPMGNFRVKVSAYGLEPGKRHEQHIHGFANGKRATVPPPDQGIYGDGITSLEEALAYTGPVLLPLTPYARANPSGFQEFTRMYRGSDLDDLDLDEVPLTNRVIMLHGGYMPAVYAYYGEIYDPMLPVAAGQIVGPYMR